MSSISFKTRLKFARGSPSKGSPSVLYTSQINRATLPCPAVHGKITHVSKSGCKYISDSSIRTNPSIEEPSNIISLSNTFSNWLTGTSTFFIVPKISVNCKRKYLTFSSFANLRMSSFVNVRFGIFESSTTLFNKSG